MADSKETAAFEYRHPPSMEGAADSAGGEPPMKRPREGGRCELILGPMFSGKTTQLMQRVQRALQGGGRCAVVKYAGDTRYGAGPRLRTHGGLSLAADEGGLEVFEATALSGLVLGPQDDLVAVDEGQFFADLPETVDRWMREGRGVVVAALDGDFLRRPFGRVGEVIPLASQLTKLSAVCMLCPRGPPGTPHPADAFYTLRTHESEDVELIGEKDKYQAACLGCYLAAMGNRGRCAGKAR